jgi:hypothetical protein
VNIATQTSFLGAGRHLQRLHIKLSEISSERVPVYIGARVRDSTMTSVTLLDANTLACCHYNGKRMFLLRFDLDAGSCRILDQTATTFGGLACETDLMAGDGRGHLVTSNFYQYTSTLYRRDGDRLKRVRDLAYNAGHWVHGIKFYRHDTVAITSRAHRAGVHFFDLESGQLRYLLPTPGLHAQDICFLSETRLVLVADHGAPGLKPQAIYSSEIQIVDFDIATRRCRTVLRKVLPNSHLDSIVAHQGLLYITDQYNGAVRVIDAQDLEPVALLEGYNFPHGLDLRGNLLAVTNYGDNSIDLRSF